MSKNIYQFKITLKEITPKIWRLIEVPSDFTFTDFDITILKAMGWDGTHASQFKMLNPRTGIKEIIASGRCSEGNTEFVYGDDVQLFQYFLINNKKAVHYYDFGDGWRHDIAFRKEFKPEDGVKYPRCIKGERACPPDDCGGGPWGYDDFIQAQENSEKMSEETRRWWGNFDPEKFDIEEVNQKLHALRLGSCEILDSLKLKVIVEE